MLKGGKYFIHLMIFFLSAQFFVINTSANITSKNTCANDKAGTKKKYLFMRSLLNCIEHDNPEDCSKSKGGSKGLAASGLAASVGGAAALGAAAKNISVINNKGLCSVYFSPARILVNEAHASTGCLDPGKFNRIKNRSTGMLRLAEADSGNKLGEIEDRIKALKEKALSLPQESEADLQKRLKRVNDVTKKLMAKKEGSFFPSISDRDKAYTPCQLLKLCPSPKDARYTASQLKAMKLELGKIEVPLSKALKESHLLTKDLSKIKSRKKIRGDIVRLENMSKSLIATRAKLRSAAFKIRSTQSVGALYKLMGGLPIYRFRSPVNLENYSVAKTFLYMDFRAAGFFTNSQFGRMMNVLARRFASPGKRIAALALSPLAAGAANAADVVDVVDGMNDLACENQCAKKNKYSPYLVLDKCCRPGGLHPNVYLPPHLNIGSYENPGLRAISENPDLCKYFNEQYKRFALDNNWTKSCSPNSNKLILTGKGPSAGRVMEISRVDRKLNIKLTNRNGNKIKLNYKWDAQGKVDKVSVNEFSNGILGNNLHKWSPGIDDEKVSYDVKQEHGFFKAQNLALSQIIPESLDMSGNCSEGGLQIPAGNKGGNSLEATE